ncbi:protein SCO1/2 [Arcticibacter pallidicorallinus]|uniref:Protein SCO1/2 n=2 Tax=Arcticibacter pallidicorallinus TaxID=1259464 RepID=A0A2T0U916_9SPHI|nr:protein SCO1/2 [Arcticibacter pallidicorallinus]
MGNTSSLKKILILVIILMVPGFLYYLLQDKGKNRYRPLSIYGPKELSGTFHTKRGKQIPDTLYHQIRDFKLSDQSGEDFVFPLDSTKIVVFNFFFTRCPNSCSEMNARMQFLTEEYEGNRMIKFASISVDPEHDSPEVLKAYSSQFNAVPGTWYFLTGDKMLIHDIARKDFLLDAYSSEPTPEGIVHSPLFVLVDPHKRIRGFYDSGNKDQMNKLNDEIKVLIAEELRMVTDR